MTKQELNKKMKNLFNNWVKHRETAINSDFFFKEEEKLKKELRDVYMADESFESLSHSNLKRFLRMNVALRGVQLHNIGLFIDQYKLV